MADEKSSSSAYPRVDLGGGSGVSFPELEQAVLDTWAADGTFRASIDNRTGAEEFVFYDGPPFANGLPHYGHLRSEERRVGRDRQYDWATKHRYKMNTT